MSRLSLGHLGFLGHFGKAIFVNTTKLAIVNFSKYQGAGNDFIMLADLQRTFPAHDRTLIARLCDRRFGIGADGLILLRISQSNLPEMVYFNSDGGKSSFCGNGGRCFAAFLYEIFGEDRLKNKVFEAADGLHVFDKNADTAHDYALSMNDVATITPAIEGGYFLDTGSPHLVLMIDNPADVDVYSLGRRLRNHPAFAPAGTNVNFVRNADPTRPIEIRTYERGVEAETLSCGTGVVAAALVSAHLAHEKQGMRFVSAPGGLLAVGYTADSNGGFTGISLLGPAEKVYEGTINV